ncbi:hypothetical protein BYT27DRAFT_7232494 [Phlegmacium glaucopus]|nr:hypothetical protein BYT27DRAFT_7232494 [Phlegmacium glaucopus]
MCSPLNTVIAIAISKADSAIYKTQTTSYPKEVLYLIASVIALISLNHFLSIFYHFITRKRVYGWKQRTAVSLARVPAAVVDSFRTLAFRWTVPIGSSHELNLAEVGLALGYIAAIFSWTFVNTTTIAGAKVDPHYFANRAGTITASQLPIMIALGMRNNIISWLTGISHIKLNLFHRISARVLCVLVWIHAGGRVSAYISTPWLQWGIIAGSAFGLLFFLAIRPIRERNYEAFLFVHFIFAFIFILGVYIHLRGLSHAYYGAWPSMILWGLDHFIRLTRLAIINFGYLNPWSPLKSKKELDAMVDVLSPDLLRVTLHRPKHFNWRPGHSAYLSFPSVSAFPFESHPFTISTIDDDSMPDENSLVFLIGVHSGFTKKLLKRAQTSQSDQTYKVFLNGPYGAPPILAGHQTIILIAGGSGVTYTLPFFLDMLRRAKAGNLACQKIVFVWAIRDSDHINWIANTLAPALNGVPPTISVAIELYITGTNATRQLQKWDESSKDNSSGSEFMVTNDSQSSMASRSFSTIVESPLVGFHQGRPDLESLISKEIADATGNIAINVCGTHSLANAARAAIRLPRPMDVLRGGPTISFHVEAFGA